MLLKHRRLKFGSRLATYSSVFLNGAVNVFKQYIFVSHFRSSAALAFRMREWLSVHPADMLALS